MFAGLALMSNKWVECIIIIIVFLSVELTDQMSCTSRKSTESVDISGNYLNLLDADALLSTQSRRHSKRESYLAKKDTPNLALDVTSSSKLELSRKSRSPRRDSNKLASTVWTAGIKPTIGVLIESSNALVTRISPNSRRRGNNDYTQVGSGTIFHSLT